MAAAFFIATLSAGWFWGHSSVPAAMQSAPAKTAPREALVVPLDGARFERTRGGGVDSVTLSSGALAVETGTSTGERLIVRTKDAELEAKDSSFHVDADNGHIRNVVVERGTVEVRYAGFIAVIPGGGSWHGDEATPSASNSTPVASVAAASGSPAPTAVAAATATNTPSPKNASVARSTPVTITAVSATPPSPAPAAPPAPPRAGAAFSSAMHTLEHGDYDSAASSLGAFADSHPNDPLADDAEYVRAIALQRAGHKAEAKSAAQHYLAARPNGAHRKEASRIASE